MHAVTKKISSEFVRHPVCLLDILNLCFLLLEWLEFFLQGYCNFSICFLKDTKP